MATAGRARQMEDQPATSHGRRREKPILSCTFCRARKLRCDRQSPCGACARRGVAAECTYTSTEQERRGAVDYRPHARSQRARQRVARLEALVTEMRDMARGPRLPPPDNLAAPSEAPSRPCPPLASGDHAADGMGKLSLLDDHAVYTGSSHWVTILEDIRRLKDELDDESSNSAPDLEPPPYGQAAAVQVSPATRISLLSSAPVLPKEQILTLVPPRMVVDRHVSHFFNAFDIAPYILHKETFLAEYANFWDNPSAVPMMWLGLLFSVMSISAFLRQQDLDALDLSAAESRATLDTYRTLTIHCLVAGDYIRPGRFAIETLTLHFSVDQNANIDASVGNWVLIGVVIRVAMRMGLHRDPSHWPVIRPLHAELRRRLWMILYQMDFFTSTQVGLPRIIKDSQCDTHPPAHLSDRDLSRDQDELPPQRPLTESTPLLHIIQRNTIIKVTAEIYDATEAGPPSPAVSAALATKLETAIAALPPWLQYRPLETSIAENPVTLLHQIFIDILIHKAVYLLHRRSFVKDVAGQDPSHSNGLCVKAALAILDHQRRLSEETQPGGLMFGVRWKVASSLNQEFLQATMMLCFALSRLEEAPAEATDRRDDIVGALAVAKGLWGKITDRSVEARRAVKAIATVLREGFDQPLDAPTAAASQDLVDPMPGLDEQGCLSFFNFGQDYMALDPSFLMMDNGAADLRGLLDNYPTSQGLP